jgi:hypothetical protein
LIWFSSVLILIIASLQPKRVEIVRVGTPFHSISHVAVFAVLMLLGAFAFRGRNLHWAAAACILLGLCIETAQHFIYRQSMEWTDWRDDTIGVGIVLGILSVAEKRLRLTVR